MQTPLQHSTPRSCILVVDDEQGPRESLRMILSPFYEVNTVRNGIQAIDFIHKEKVDLVTLDLNMPGLPGIDALRQIKKIDNNVDVVIITGYGTIRTAMDAARFGAADFICKPFNIPEIFSTVRRCFERRAYRLQLKNFIGEIRVKLQDKSQAVSLLALVEESDFGSKPGKLQKELKACLRLFEGRQGADSRSHFTDFLRGLARSSEKISCRPIGHAERVLRYAQIIAQDLSSSPKDTADLAKAALLHDIGKIGLGPIASEKTCLSRDELLYVRRHPLVGALLIESFENSPTVTSAIRHHHECWDGKGFPYGLAGEEIPPLARILALANHYDTLVPAGGGRGRILMEKVREEIRKGCGSLFEPALTDSLLKRLADGPLPVGKDEEKNPICGPSLFSPEESQEESLFVF